MAYLLSLKVKLVYKTFIAMHLLLLKAMTQSQDKQNDSLEINRHLDQIRFCIPLCTQCPQQLF